MYVCMYIYIYVCVVSWNVVVGILTRCEMAVGGLKPGEGEPFHTPQTAVGPTEPPVKWVACGIKRPPPSSAEVEG